MCPNTQLTPFVTTDNALQTGTDWWDCLLRPQKTDESPNVTLGVPCLRNIVQRLLRDRRHLPWSGCVRSLHCFLHSVDTPTHDPTGCSYYVVHRLVITFQHACIANFMDGCLIKCVFNGQEPTLECWGGMLRT